MSRSSRKWDHVQHALAIGQSERQGMDDLSFIPNSLPNVSYVNTNMETKIGSLHLSSPIIINAMTGGAEQTTELNRRLAIIAAQKGLAMAVGSQMAALRDPSQTKSYTVVREENPNGLVFANLGAEATVDQAKHAVEMLNADGLQIHLNVMQELVMPEGDRDFIDYLKNIERITKVITVPIIVKEVGFGMSRQTILQLIDAGVRIIDVGGSGGTNFAKVENLRKANPFPMFDEWGVTTVQSLLEARECVSPNTFVIASGGIRHGLDICKALALGASAVGMAGRFLQLVQSESIARCLEVVDEWHHQLRIAMTALGLTTVSHLQHVPLIVTGESAEWARLRGIDLTRLAQRGL